MQRQALLRAALIALAIAAFAAVVAGCGSDSDSSSTESSSGSTGASTTGQEETTAQEFTGEPIVVASSVTINSPLASFPGTPAALEASARAINEEGGIAGREVKIDVCDGKADPNAEVACARRAVDANAVAVVGEITIVNPQGFMDALKQAGIADVGSTALGESQFTYPNSFPLDFPTGEFAACPTPELLKAAGAGNIGAAQADIAVSANNTKFVETAAKNLGTEFVGTAVAAPTTTDYAPTMQELSDLGAEMVMLSTAGTAAPAVMSAGAASGDDFSYCSADGTLFPSQLIKLGPQAEGFYQGASLPPLSAASEYPVMEEFVEQMEAEEAAGNSDATLDPTTYNSNTLRAWLGMQAFKQVAESIKGEINSDSFLKAISTAKVDFGDVIPSIDFTKPAGTGEYARIFNAAEFAQEWDVASQEFKSVPGVEVNALEAVGNAK